MPKFIIWTRSRDDWPSDEMLFPPTSGLSLLHLPCITTRPLPLAVTGTAAGRFAVLFFTSVRAIRMSLADPGLAAIVRSAPLVLTFGERCARELAHGGVACERPAVESARELVRHFAQKIAPTLPAGAQLAAIGPLHPAYNAKPAISSLGFGYTYLAIYETVPALELKDDERSALSHSLD